MFKTEDKVKLTYGSGGSITNQTNYDFKQIQSSGEVLNDDQEKTERAGWFDAPKNSLDAPSVLAAGFKGHYDEDLVAETCLGFYSKTSPVDGLA